MSAARVGEWLRSRTFPPRMPAADYVRQVPHWAFSGEDESAHMALAMHHVALWSGDGAVSLSADRWGDACNAMEVLMALEALRRCGIHRFSATGDGRLLDDTSTVTVEMNPACLALAVCGRVPDMREMMAAAMTTDWVDLAALGEPTS